MKIINIAVKRVYKFNCPNCGSCLEGEPDEFIDIGDKVKKFYCPICGKERFVKWSDLHKKTVYRD